MKTLILYATKTGTTKKCAALLSARLGAENTDMRDIADGEPSLSAYDTLVLGSPVRLGRVDPRISGFIERHKPEIMMMRLGVFTCGCLPDRAADAFSKNFSLDLIEHAICMDTFGGELKPEKLRGTDRLIVKMMEAAAKTDERFRPVTRLLPDSMANFARELKKSAGEPV